MHELWFCITLLAFVAGYYFGMIRGTEKVIKIIDELIRERASRKIVHIDTRRILRERKK